MACYVSLNCLNAVDVDAANWRSLLKICHFQIWTVLNDVLLIKMDSYRRPLTLTDLIFSKRFMVNVVMKMVDVLITSYMICTDGDMSRLPEVHVV